MKVVLCGLPFCGKSAVFQALVGKHVQPKTSGAGKLHLQIGTLEVRDERLEKLGKLLNSQKITYSQITLVDVTFAGEQAQKGIDTAYLREFDLLALVMGVFTSQDAESDWHNIEQELLLADMQLVQARMEKIYKERTAAAKKEAEAELALLERCQKALEEETPLRSLNLSAQELKLLAGFQLLTLKPWIIIANLSEEQLQTGSVSNLEQKVKEKGLQFFSLCAKLEAEIEELPEAEREKFAQEMGLQGLSRQRFIPLCFQALEKIFFFTVVGKEARAWPIARGTTALEAAGSVHSDMQRGFIRAEVINYQDLLECGTFAKAKEKGRLRLESKEYAVNDGDVINFKFSV